VHVLESWASQNKYLQDVYINPHKLFTLTEGVELWKSSQCVIKDAHRTCKNDMRPPSRKYEIDSRLVLGVADNIECPLKLYC
jgi:hypothetical protein